MRLDLAGMGDDGLVSFGIFLTGDAERQGAQSREFHVHAVVEVLGSKRGDGIHHADDVSLGETGVVGNVFCHLLERYGGTCHYLRDKALGFTVTVGFAARTWY